MPSVKKFPISPEARRFLAGLTLEAGMDILPPKLRENLLEELAKRLDAKLTIAALSALPSDKVTGFENLLLKKAPAAKLEQYLKDNCLDIGSVYSQALIDFRNTYLAS